MVFKLRHQFSKIQKLGRFNGVRTAVIILITFALYSLPITFYAALPLHDVRKETSVIVFLDFSTLLLNSGPILSTVTYGGTNLKFKASVAKLRYDLCRRFGVKTKPMSRITVAPAEKSSTCTISERL